MSCPKCFRRYVLKLDLEKLKRLRQRAQCGRCGESFDIGERLAAKGTGGADELRRSRRPARISAARSDQPPAGREPPPETAPPRGPKKSAMSDVEADMSADGWMAAPTPLPDPPSASEPADAPGEAAPEPSPRAMAEAGQLLSAPSASVEEPAAETEPPRAGEAEQEPVTEPPKAPREPRPEPEGEVEVEAPPRPADPMSPPPTDLPSTPGVPRDLVLRLSDPPIELDASELEPLAIPPRPPPVPPHLLMDWGGLAPTSLESLEEPDDEAVEALARLLARDTPADL